MTEPKPLTQFFRENGALDETEFTAAFDGAFLLFRFGKTPPLVLFVSQDPGAEVTIGSDEDCTLESFQDPTLDPIHAIVSYHPGFRGWTIEDKGSNFGTHVDGDRISPGRPTLLQDRAIIKAGGGLTEIQFYLAPTLFGRIRKAGVTASLRRLQKTKTRARSATTDDPETRRVKKAAEGVKKPAPVAEDPETKRVAKPAPPDDETKQVELPAPDDDGDTKRLKLPAPDDDGDTKRLKLPPPVDDDDETKRVKRPT